MEKAFVKKALSQNQHLFFPQQILGVDYMRRTVSPQGRTQNQTVPLLGSAN